MESDWLLKDRAILSLLRPTGVPDHIPGISLSAELPNTAPAEQWRSGDSVRRPFDVRDVPMWVSDVANARNSRKKLAMQTG